MKLKGHSPVDLIINNRKLIEKIYIVLVIFSLICVPMVGINYDLTKYLPDSSPSAQALDIMEDEFTYPGMGRVMLEDVTLYEAKNIKDRIADVDGVDMVMWCDMATNIYGSSEFINYDNIDDYYKDNTAYMDVIFTDKDSSNQTHKAVHEIENIVGDKGLVAGSAVSDTNLGPTINKEVARVMALAVVIIYIILTITTTSWFEPVLFLSVLGIAILINMGTNIIFGEISFLSNAVGAVLQLACSMDYSIFLLHAFTQERATGAEPEQAMANAWRTAFSSIGASGMTTIVGFAAMALMNFGIGPDMGFVLAKGIALSLMTVLLLMPALILRSQNIIAKTQHRPFIPKQGRGIGEFAYKIRRIVFLVVLIIIIPCYIAQGMANFSYGNEAVANSPGTPVYEAEQQMNAKFGKSNMMIALVPPDSNITEKKMTEEIDDLSYVKYALSLSSVLPEGIPEDFLPENITSLMHSKNWARVIINVRSAGESDDAFQFSDNIRAIIDKYYPNETTYLVGVTPSTQDIKDIIVPDYNRVNIVSLLGVALVIAITYKALILPIVVLIPIERAIFINTALPYIYGQPTACKIAFRGLCNLIECIRPLFRCLGRRGHIRFKAIRHEKSCGKSATLNHSADLLDIVLNAGLTACIGFGHSIFVHPSRILLHIDRLRKPENLHTARCDLEPCGKCAYNADTLCRALQKEIHRQHFKQPDKTAIPCVDNAAVNVCDWQTALQIITCGGELLRALRAKNRVFYVHI